MGKKKIKPFGRHIKHLLECYFDDLKGAEPMGLHQQMIEELELHLFKYVIKHAKGNISHAARILGVSRATLRKKLAQYEISVN